MTMRLHLLGAPALEHDGVTATLAAERRSQLLAYLARKRTWVGRAEAAALLWPDAADKLAYTNLRKALFRMQDAAWGTHVESEAGALRCRLPTDVDDFEQALACGRRAEALALWRGDFLDGFDDIANPAWSSWLAFERERLRSAMRAVALARLDEDIEPEQGIAIAARLLAMDPLDEAALRAQMTWLDRSGQAARARQAYREFAVRLEAELGIAPGMQLRAAHDALGVAVPPSVSQPARDPAAAGFVGRTVELRQVVTLLRDAQCRLLTVIGPGGVGKTRFAQRAIAELAPTCTHGAVFVPLEDVRSAAELPLRLAQELGLKVAPRQPAVEAVERFVESRDMLLVLDNFEHLADGAAVLARLCAAAPRLRVLVTSRVRLGIAAEQLLPLEGLACPEAEDSDRLESFDAARLFVQAAQRVEPALVPAAEAAAIVDICRQLDGLPLALELAASWTRVLSCDAIATELREGSGLLHAVDPARPPRHASFEVVFDHSWRLLREAEREALARLSVFRGGFTAEAARATARAPLAVLLALVDKSLLRKEAGRLHLHPLVAELAASRLVAFDGDGATRQAHAQYYLRLLGHQVAALDRGQDDAMRTIDAEFDNCRAAWITALDGAPGEILFDGVRALVSYCDHRGQVATARALLEQALQMRAAADARFRLDVTSRLAHLRYRLDEYDQAIELAGSTLAAADPERDARAILQCHYVLGGCALRRGALDEAEAEYRRGVALAGKRGNPREVAALLDNISIVVKRQGRLDEAIRLTVDSLATLRRIDDPANLALCLSNLASHYQLQGDFASARVHLGEAKALTDRLGLVGTRAFVCGNLAVCDRALGDLPAADAHIDEAMTAAAAAGNRSVICWLHYQRSSLAVSRGDLALARDELATMAAMAVALASPNLTIGAVELMAEVLVAQEQGDCARQLLRFAIEHPATDRAQADELGAKLAALPATDSERPWPGMELAELAQRISAERDVAHAPLVAALRSTG